MSATSPLRLVDGGPLEPQVFVRAFSAPPGLPWDQARMAELDARLGAPLPLAELAYRLRRLEPWRPGRPVRYAAFYVRAGEVRDGLTAEPEVDGRPVRVVFGSPGEMRRRVRRLGILAGAAALVVVACAGVGVALVSARTRATERLETAEQTAAVQLRRAEARARRAEQARALDAAPVQGRRLHDLIVDLVWASTAKSAQARIEGVHWDRGYLGFEVRGDEAPFEHPDRPLEKAAKAVRPGVQLWGVAPAGTAAIRAGPVPAAGNVGP